MKYEIFEKLGELARSYHLDSWMLWTADNDSTAQYYIKNLNTGRKKRYYIDISKVSNVEETVKIIIQDAVKTLLPNNIY